MANKNFNTRIRLKNDTEANWSKAINFIPLQGEAIVYSADSSHPFSRLKIGDGVTNVNDLPFLFGTSYRVVTQAQYEALSNEEKMNGTIYLISDADSIPSSEGVGF